MTTTSPQQLAERPLMALKYTEVAQVRELTDVALITVSQIAQHGPHLPVGADVYQLREVARRMLERLRGRGLYVLVGPEIPVGLSPTHLSFPGHVNLQPATLMNLVLDIGDSLVAQGFRRLIILNGGGGNWSALEDASYHLWRRYEDARVYLLGWFETVMGVLDDLTGNVGEGAGKDGHGGAWETSCMLRIAPELVDMDKAEAIYPDLAQEISALPFVNTNWNDRARLIGLWRIENLADTGVWGNPVVSTAEAGDRVLDHASTTLADHIARYVFDVR
jgi:creatinine amidohydrolase